MIADTSGLLAIVFREPGHESVLEKLLQATVVRISAGTMIEARMIAVARGVEEELNQLLQVLQAEIVSVDEEQVDLAIEGFRTYGRGRHPAQLNFGDLFAYALARQKQEPLLFVGQDFSQTALEKA